jgi:voltage-gated potassium channel
VLGFLGGAWLRRAEILAIVTAHRVRDERRFGRALLWLLPVFAIGAATFAVPGSGLDQAGRDIALLLAMAAIGLVVAAVSSDVSSFLIDTGLLFEEFFRRARHLLMPAFAFLTFCSLLVIIFASFYRILDRLSAASSFTIGGAHRDITFADSLYFSIVTLSTVGYGDILPEGDFVRVVVAVEVVLGVILLLFGFSEIMGYSRGRRRDGD